jgi:hypothetical protein
MPFTLHCKAKVGKRKNGLERFQKYRSHRKGIGSRIARQRFGLRQPSAAFLPQH